MIDHCSCTWGLDDNISFYRHMYDPSEGQYESKDLKLPTVNVTIQNTISAKALDTYNHAFGSTLGGENCAFMRNLWASNSGRNPSVGWNGVFNFVNNVVFNWVHRSSDGGDYTAMFNMINNYYKPGPATPKNNTVGCRILKPEAGRSKLNYKVYGRVYADGNVMEGYPEITKDNWNGGTITLITPHTAIIKNNISHVLVRCDAPRLYKSLCSCGIPVTFIFSLFKFVIFPRHSIDHLLTVM